MATAAELQSLIDAVNSIVDDVNARLEIVQSNLDGIDVNATNALDQYNTILAERDAAAEVWNSSASAQYSQLVSAFESSPAEVRDAVNTQWNTLNARITSFQSFAKNQKNVSFPAKKKEIEDAQANKKNEDGTNPGEENIVQPPPSDDGEGTGRPVTPPDPKNVPGRRYKNPLGFFSSYTYQLTLYMMTPAARDEFIRTGRKNPFIYQNGIGTIIVAQSGGINKQQRSPKLPYDFYIDNLKFTTATNPKATQDGVFVIDFFKFNIIEPYGFNFITALKEAAIQLQNADGSATYKKQENPARQFYCIGIRFLGYDENGNIMTGDKTYNGGILDPNYSQSTGNGLFERFYDINFVSVTFKINAKTTIYDITASVTSEIASYSQKRGFLNANYKMQGSTVGEMLTQLMTKLEADENDLKEKKSVRLTNSYSIDWSAPGAEFIKNAKVVLPEDTDKQKTGTSPAQNSTDSNPAVGEKVAPNLTERINQNNRDTPITQIMQNVIKFSTYVRDSLKENPKSKLDPAPPRDEAENVDKPDTAQPIRWVNISAEATEPEFDDLRKDYVYKIKYIIRPYETPWTDSAYANKRSVYPGPFKRYEYWYTGQNSEIVNYEQSMKLSYFNNVLDPSVDTAGKSSQGQATVPSVPNRTINQDKTNAQDKGAQAINNYINSLYDPASFTDVSITIIGDPDFITATSDTSYELDQEYRKYYGPDGYTINANGSQIFIEVNFYEGIDYDLQKGYLNINNKIEFYRQPDTIRNLKGEKIDGVCFMVVSVANTFANGKFTQILKCNLISFGDPAAPANA